LWRTRRKDDSGATLVEVLVVMFVMSILTAAALPQLQKQSLRTKETQLRHDLTEVRRAIDTFHIDWRKGEIAQTGGFVSVNGYPTSWEALTDGVPVADGTAKRRYLRAIPSNPFATDPDDPWRLFGQADMQTADSWNGLDIFDVRANTKRKALDGTQISDW
jgi:type II secretory pathway pseudopilin PulG